jgi:hypothetical protein
MVSNRNSNRLKSFAVGSLQIGYRSISIKFLIRLLFRLRVRGPSNCDTVLRWPSRYTICVVFTKLLARWMPTGANEQSTPANKCLWIIGTVQRSFLPECQNAAVNIGNTPSGYSLGREEFQFFQKTENLSRYPHFMMTGNRLSSLVLRHRVVARGKRQRYGARRWVPACIHIQYYRTVYTLDITTAHCLMNLNCERADPTSCYSLQRCPVSRIQGMSGSFFDLDQTSSSTCIYRAVDDVSIFYTNGNHSAIQLHTCEMRS